MSYFEFPNTRTYDNDLGWLIKNAKTENDAIQALQQFQADSEEAFEQLRQLLDDIERGAFPQEISNAIRNYIANNFYDIVGDMIRFVWFGLTDSGYFVAYIPENWKELEFATTDYDFFDPEFHQYGHLAIVTEV